MSSTNSNASLWDPITCPRFVIYGVATTPKQKAVAEIVDILLRSTIIPPLPFETIPLIWLKNKIRSLNLETARQYGSEGKDFFKAALEVEYVRCGDYSQNVGMKKTAIRALNNRLVLKTFDSYSLHLAPRKIQEIIAMENFPKALSRRYRVHVLLGIIAKVAPIETSKWAYAVGRKVFKRLKTIEHLSSPDIRSLLEAPKTIFSTTIASRRLRANKLIASRRGGSASTSRKTSNRDGAGKAAKLALLGAATSASAIVKSRSSTRS